MEQSESMDPIWSHLNGSRVRDELIREVFRFRADDLLGAVN
jgi:hypothetical protein